MNKIIKLVSGLCILSFSTLLIANSEKPKWDVNNPPGEAYTAKIDVTEGTWMNVDLSPDGKTLIFDLLGDIYSMPVTGGKALPLTQSIAWEMQPTFSPDGKWIAFTSDAGGGDNIWVMKADGSEARQVTKESFRLLNSPAWSPDGQYLAARKHFTSSRSLGAGEIWLYHFAGGKGLQLNKRPNDQKDLGEPAFSSDGKKVFFSRDSTAGKIFEYSKDSNKVIYEIFSINRSNGEIERVVSGHGGSVRPTPSPDGKKLAFVRRIRNQSSLFIKDLTTGEETTVYQSLDRDMQETWAIHGVYPTMTWTNDSRDLIFWAGGKIRNLNTATLTHKEIPFHVTTEKSMREAVSVKVDPAPEKDTTKMLRWTQVSPDGKKVIFQALGYLYIQNLPNGKPKRLTRQEDHFEFYPRFSADGKKVVYTTWNDEKQGQVMIVSASGGRGKAVTQKPGQYLSPSISRDGKTVVYQKVRGGYITSPKFSAQPGIYQVSAKGGESKLVTKSGSSPFFGSENDRVFITQRAGKKRKLVSMDLNGGNIYEHASTSWATEFAVSPKENWIAFTERFHVYLAPLTSASKAIELSPNTKSIPLKKLSADAGEFLSFSEDGNRLHWSLGNTLFTAEIPAANTWQDNQFTTQSTQLGFEYTLDVPRGKIALTGARIITMENDLVIEQGDIVVDGNRIIAIGKSGKVEIPDNATRIDVNGKTIIPGIVDAHWHGAQGTGEIIPQQNWENFATLAFGVTTIHDPSNDTSTIFSASEMARAGEIVAPRIFSTGTILYGAETSFTANVNSIDDAQTHLNRMKEAGAFSVKSYNQPRRDQRQQILEAARQNNMLVVPEGGSLLQHNLTMIVDGHSSIEHSIPPAAIYEDVKQLWGQARTTYTPTLVVAFGGIWGEHYWYQHQEVWKHPLLKNFVPKQILWPRSIRRNMAPDEDYNHFQTAAIAKQLLDLGVKVQVGAHGQREGLGAHWEMWMFAQGGMTPMEVLQVATINGAKLIGMDEHIGSIKVGKLADLVVLDSNPLENIYQSDRVNKVMINGRLFDANTMNQKGNHQQDRKPFYFEK